MIRAKVEEYLDRAEKLKTHLDKQEQKEKRPGAVGANGKAAGGGGGGKKCVDSTCLVRSRC